MPWMVFAGSLIRLLIHFLLGSPRQSLMRELFLVRQENAILRRKGRRPKLAPEDRIILGAIAGTISRRRLQKIASTLRPATLLHFHRLLVARKYSLLYGHQRTKPGPKGPSPELIQFVTEAKQKNPSYGCEKIALLATQRLGKAISHQTVRCAAQQNYYRFLRVA